MTSNVYTQVSANLVQQFAIKFAAKTPAWQRAEGQSESGGLSEAGRKSYERETGGNLKAPVTESNPSGERAKRQNSFCSRMCGMKRVNTGASTAKDPDSRINKSLRKWNCKCSSAAKFGYTLREKLAAETGARPAPIKPTAGASKPRTLGATLFPDYSQRQAIGRAAMEKIIGKPNTWPNPFR